MKLNNKGFAFTTLVYGLIIVSSLLLFVTLSMLDSTKNNSELISDSENERLLWCYYKYEDGNNNCSAAFIP